MSIIDCDQHLFEQPDTWARYIEPRDRALAISIEPDDLGYWWVTSRVLGARMYHAWVSTPGDLRSLGRPMEGWHAGLPSEMSYVDDMPPDFVDPNARIDKLDEWGIDEAVLVPHWGLIWPRGIGNRLDILRANLGAYNRWITEVQQESGGRLHAVGHVSLRGADDSWLESQLRLLADGGVKLAMLNYGLVDGRPPSHPDHDRAWRRFLDHGITPVWHTNDNDQRASALPEAWFENDDDRMLAVLEMPFWQLGIQVAVADMVLNGVFDRIPELRFAIIELHAEWLTSLARRMNGGYTMVRDVTGRYHCELRRRPSEYIADHFRIAPAFGDPVEALFEEFGPIFMFGSDYPHAEGLASPYKDYQAAVGALPESASAALYGGTVATLL